MAAAAAVLVVVAGAAQQSLVNPHTLQTFCNVTVAVAAIVVALAAVVVMSSLYFDDLESDSTILKHQHDMPRRNRRLSTNGRRQVTSKMRHDRVMMSYQTFGELPFGTSKEFRM